MRKWERGRGNLPDARAKLKSICLGNNGFLGVRFMQNKQNPLTNARHPPQEARLLNRGTFSLLSEHACVSFRGDVRINLNMCGSTPFEIIVSTPSLS